MTGRIAWILALVIVVTAAVTLTPVSGDVTATQHSSAPLSDLVTEIQQVETAANQAAAVGTTPDAPAVLGVGLGVGFGLVVGTLAVYVPARRQ